MEQKYTQKLSYSPPRTAYMDPELQRHANQLIKYEEEMLKEKLQKQQRKQEKIKQIQTNFVKWAQSKNETFHLDHEKHEKKREEEIAKIVKKCQTKNKYVVKKQQDFKLVKKKKMNIDWKKAQKFNQDIQSYYKSKNFLSKTLKTGPSGQSLHIQGQPEDQDLKEMKQSDKTGINQSLVFMNNNNSKVYTSMNNQSTFFNMTQYTQPAQAKVSQKLFYTENHRQINEGEDYKQKFIQAMEKVRQRQQNEYLRNIQHMGTKYSKIEESRSRRKQMQKKKYTRNSPDRQRNITSYQSDIRINKGVKKNVRKTHTQDKIHSEDAWKREKRVRDRTEQTKQRRQQMLDKHLVAGDQYLENLRVKHLKTVIAKNIAYNAMQKKKYLQRLNN